MPENLTPQEEAAIISAVKAAGDFVASGSTANAALEKVARDRGYGPGWIRLVAHAYNTGQQNAQWQAPGSILEKLATFDLADPEAVIQSIYSPPEKKAGVSNDYAGAPDWLPKPAAAEFPVPVGTEKTAAEQVTGPRQDHGLGRIERAMGAFQRAKTAADEASRQASAAKDRVRAGVARLTEYFKQAAAVRLPFPDFQMAAASYFGERGENLCRLLASPRLLAEKSASVKLAKAIDWTAHPYRDVVATLQNAEQCVTLTKTAEDLQARLPEVREQALRPFVAARPEPPVKRASLLKEIGAIATGDILAHHATTEKHEPPSETEQEIDEMDDEIEGIREQANAVLKKRAGLLSAPAVGAALGTMMGRTLGPAGKSKNDLVDDAWMDLEDPEHANEVRKIRTQANLAQLMNSPNDPISSHGPEEVMQAVNEIAETAPRVADNLATLRPVLRRRLTAHQEPFEVNELLNVEKNLAASKTPTPQTTLLAETPKSLLG